MQLLRLPLPLLFPVFSLPFYLLLLPSLTTAIFIVFEGRNPTLPTPPPPPPIYQICDITAAPTYYPASSICCAPLDLNIMDGASYGWFHTSKVSYTNIMYPDTFTAVYARPPPGAHNIPPCSGEIIDHRTGNRPWETKTGLAREAGSAIAYPLTPQKPREMERKIPDRILVGEKEYLPLGKQTSGNWWFGNEKGEIIFGRELAEYRVAGNGNGNGTALEEGEGDGRGSKGIA